MAHQIIQLVSEIKTRIKSLLFFKSSEPVDKDLYRYHKQRSIGRSKVPCCIRNKKATVQNVPNYSLRAT